MKNLTENLTQKLILVFLSLVFAHPLSFAEGPSIERGFADLVKKVGPGVVNISTFARPKIQQGGPLMYNDDTFRRFFEDFFGGRIAPPGQGPRGENSGENGEENDDEGGPMPPPHSAPKKGKPMPLALGTGFIIDANEGLILTNYHVVQGSEEVKIQFAEDEDELASAEIIGRDPELDVALLKVKVKRKLTGINLGDSEKIDVGEYVLAIGNPLGYGHTVSHGILSAKGRRNPEFRLGKYLQTDASINPGNSGGPLVNMKGEVVGINNAIDARGQGIGFAIPINLIKAILPQLKAKGSVSRGYLGVSTADLTSEISDQLKMDSKIHGVLIADVGRGTPADRGGLRAYDVITSVNGEKIGNAQDLTAKITSIPIGEIADIHFVRGGKEKSATVTIAERPVNGMLSEGHPVRPEATVEKSATLDAYGFTVSELNEHNGAYYGIPTAWFKGKKLLVVSEVEPNQAAANSGLNRGDVVLDIGGKEVHSIADIQRFFKNITGKTLMSQGGEFVSVIVLSKP